MRFSLTPFVAPLVCLVLLVQILAFTIYKESGVVVGDVTQAQAVNNRTEIEGNPTNILPGAVKIDRALQVSDGQSITGGSLTNAFTSGGHYGRTLLCDPDVGFGYYSSIKVTGPYSIQLSDPNDAQYFLPGRNVYLWVLDGFQNGQRTLRGIQAISGVDIKLYTGGPPLNPGLTAAKWYANSVFIGDISAGKKEFTLSVNPFAIGSWVCIDEGPSVGNEGRREWHRIVASTAKTISLDSPTFRSYSAALLAKVTPRVGVSLSNLSIEIPVDPGSSAALLKSCVNWRLDRTNIRGFFAPVSLSRCIFTNCNFEAVQINSCSCCSFINCTFNRVLLEEASFNVEFLGCTFGPPAENQSALSCNTGTHALTIRGCKITAPSGQAIGLSGPDIYIDACTIEGAAYLQSDRLRLTNCTGNNIAVQEGSGCYVERCSGITLGLIGRKSSGVAFDCPNVILTKSPPNQPPIQWKLYP